MIKKHDRKSFCWGFPGIILQTLGIISFGGDLWSFPFEAGLGLWSLGTALLAMALMHAAKAKDRSPAWGFLSLLHIPGVAVVTLLEDRTVKKPSAGEAPQNEATK